jgi:aspartyl-tRNA(Asn)/glutamyl-tRNA(Gln) amidotransferase subunit C
MAVTRKDVEKIAQLAELAVDDAAARELEQQLSRILDYVAQLAEVRDDAGVGGDARAARLRPDVLAPDPLSRAPQQFAPAFKDGLFTVPRLGELDRGDDVP